MRKDEATVARRISILFVLFLMSVVSAAQEERRRPTGSVFVPLDSWVYPALKRLAALGYAPDLESLAMPWTRRQCLVLVQEAEDIASRRSTQVSAGKLHEEALRLISALTAEFSEGTELADGVHVESIYTRFTQVSAAPLRDSYHFGATIVNDFGRPYGAGSNVITGISEYGTYRRFFAYFRGEFQQAGSGLTYGQRVRDFIANTDGIPVADVRTPAAANRFDPLEMYLGAQVGDFNVSVGKESLWWGPGQESAFHFSDNAEPIYMIRVSQTTPFLLPGAFRLLGRIHMQFVIGRLIGHESPPRPFLNAQKITFQFTPNFELGFTRSAIFGGVGHPLTIGSIWRSFFSTSSSGSTVFGSRTDPGDRRSGFDFRWYLPGLRRRVSLYSDSLADDEPNPLDSPKRSAWGPGIYFTQLPRLRSLDLRLETYSTWLYRKDYGGLFIYWNNQYHDAYTNNGNIFGSWVGRDARTYTASSTYWFSAQNKVTATFRQTKAGSDFLPGGGTQTDAGLNVEWELRSGLLVNAFGQYERYFVPILGRPRHDIATGIEVTFYPKNWEIKR